MARRRELCDDEIISALLSSSSDEMLSDMSDDDSVHDKDYVQLSESTDSEEEIPSPRKRRYDTYRGTGTNKTPATAHRMLLFDDDDFTSGLGWLGTPLDMKRKGFVGGSKMRPAADANEQCAPLPQTSCGISPVTPAVAHPSTSYDLPYFPPHKTLQVVRRTL